jgi:peptidoglycan/LPS O-acetylase OafA/YrhL
MGFIRLFLALSVMVWHMPNRNFAGLDAGVAVLFFFILSGFYMALTINENFQAGLNGWRRRFYLSRLFRLYPAYLALLAASVLWDALSHAPNVFLANPGVNFSALLGLVALNIGILGQDVYKLLLWSGSYPGAQRLSHAITAAMPANFFENRWMVLPQAWTLGSELLFYAVAPFLVRSVPRMLVVLGLGLCVRWVLIFRFGFMSELWGYRFFPATICFFLLGGLAYHLYRRIAGKAWAGWVGGGVFAGFAGFALVSMLRWRGVLLAPDFATGYDTLRIWAAYLVFAGALPWLFCCWRRSRIDRLVGELSYPLYLAHELVISVVFETLKAGPTGREIAVVVLAIGVAAAVWLVIDRPVDAWRHRRFAAPGGGWPRRVWVLAVCGALVVFANTARVAAAAPAPMVVAAPVVQ